MTGELDLVEITCATKMSSLLDGSGVDNTLTELRSGGFHLGSAGTHSNSLDKKRACNQSTNRISGQ